MLSEGWSARAGADHPSRMISRTGNIPEPYSRAASTSPRAALPVCRMPSCVMPLTKGLRLAQRIGLEVIARRTPSTSSRQSRCASICTICTRLTQCIECVEHWNGDAVVASEHKHLRALLPEVPDMPGDRGGEIVVAAPRPGKVAAISATSRNRDGERVLSKSRLPSDPVARKSAASGPGWRRDPSPGRFGREVASVGARCAESQRRATSVSQPSDP